jgi:hypothetical protein
MIDDGQHRATPGSGAPGMMTGQRGILDKGVKVGQLSGGEQAMSVPACDPCALVSTERGRKDPDKD